MHFIKGKGGEGGEGGIKVNRYTFRGSDPILYLPHF